MNLSLLKEIVFHVYAHFAIFTSDFVNLKTTDSLMNPQFLLKEKISFEVEKTIYQGQIWGCQITVGPQEIKILLGDCTLDKEFPEFAMIIQPKNAPSYGLYLIYNTLSSSPKDSQPMIAVSPDEGKGWMQCNAGLQATF